MRGFVQWIDEKGFWVKDYWDEKTQKMKTGGAYLKLFPHQRRILGYALTPREDGTFPHTRVLYSEIKKSGKTTLEAAIACWYAEEAEAGTEIYVVANDDDQSKQLALADIKYHMKHEHPKDVWMTKGNIEFENGTFIQSVARDYASASGKRHALTLWDELHGYKSENTRRLWSEMTPIPTIPGSLQVVVTYAGFEGESELLWDMYLRGVGPEEHKDGQGKPLEGFEDLPVWVNGDLFTFWSHEPRMPWQTEEYYESERQNSRPADYLRLHENRWVTSHEAFIDVAWWDMAARHYGASALIKTHPYQGWPLYAAVDVGIRHDNAAVVGVAYDRTLGKVSLVFHRIWQPVEGEDFDLEGTVEKFLLMAHRKFKINKVGYDPYQFHRSMVTLRSKGLQLEAVEQNSGNMTAASQGLFDLLRQKNLWAYPDDEARKHIQNSVAKDTGRGFRIIKDPNQTKARKGATKKPVDFAVALAMACHLAVESGGVDVSQPVRIEAPFADMASDYDDPTQAALPFPLRS
jgi:phage terminase large subunit-like protein